MKKKLFAKGVRITRLVRFAKHIAATELEAEHLACNAANTICLANRDVDGLRVIEGLYDLPVGWESAVPYGSDEASAYKILIVQFASDAQHYSPRFNGFEAHGCTQVGQDERGTMLLEQCDDSLASIWSVYGHLVTGGLECLGDFQSKAQADEFCRQIVEIQGMWAQADEHFSASGTGPFFAEDHFLESMYEDRVSGGNYEDF